MTSPSFVTKVGKAQYREGVVDIPGAHAHRFAADGAVVNVRLPGSKTPVRATVGRRANLNHTPRIVGGTRLRDWFQKTTRAGDMIRILIENSDRIEIVPARPRTPAAYRRSAVADTAWQEGPETVS